MSGFNKTQQLAIGITPMFTGSLSAISSFTIIVMMFRSEQGLSTSYRRIIFGMSLFDIFLSVSMALSSLPSPKGTTGTWNPQGNEITCAIQGFFFYIGCVGAPLYNLGLSVYYLCLARYEMTNQAFRKKVEKPFIHVIPIGYSLATGILFICRDLYHDVGVGCFLSPYPRGCLKYPKLKCERGEDYRWYFIAYHQIASFIAIIVIMVLIVWTVFERERRSRQYRSPRFFSPNGNDQTNSNDEDGGNFLTKILNYFSRCTVRCPTPQQDRYQETNDQSRISTSNESATSSVQRRGRRRNSVMSPRMKEAVGMAAMYVGAYFITLLFPYILRLMERYSSADIPFTIYFLSRFFYPLQGFFNMLVYTRPHVKTLQRRHGYTWRMALWKVITQYGGEVPYNRRRWRQLRQRRRRSTRLTPVVGHLNQSRRNFNETAHAQLGDVTHLDHQSLELRLNEISHDGASSNVQEDDEENVSSLPLERTTDNQILHSINRPISSSDEMKQEEEMMNTKDCLAEDLPMSFSCESCGNLEEQDENDLVEA